MVDGEKAFIHRTLKGELVLLAIIRMYLTFIEWCGSVRFVANSLTQNVLDNPAGGERYLFAFGIWPGSGSTPCKLILEEAASSAMRPSADLWRR